MLKVKAKELSEQRNYCQFHECVFYLLFAPEMRALQIFLSFSCFCEAELGGLQQQFNSVAILQQKTTSQYWPLLGGGGALVSLPHFSVLTFANQPIQKGRALIICSEADVEGWC